METAMQIISINNKNEKFGSSRKYIAYNALLQWAGRADIFTGLIPRQTSNLSFGTWA